MKVPRGDGQRAKQARWRTLGARLVPPRPGSLETLDAPDGEAEGWAKGLHGGKRVWAVRVLGNALLLVLLVGVPTARGYSRARATQHAYASVAACLYGGEKRAAPGLGADLREQEHFAAELLRRAPGWPARCVTLLDALMPEPALFVLPGVKQAEARVHEAAVILRKELAAIASYRVGMPMPKRPLQAMELLRTSIAAQLSQATWVDAPVQSPLSFARAGALATPARLPLYVGHDAALWLEADDHAVRALGLDRTGLSYLGVTPGKPFVHARLTRPRLLQGVARAAGMSWLVWATPESRCAERAGGCYGKSTGLAGVAGPVLELPEPRHLAAHIAGRVDRSLAVHEGSVLLAARSASGRVGVHEFALPDGSALQGELPPLAPRASWAPESHGALVLAGQGGLVALGTSLQGDDAQLQLLGRERATPLSSLTGAGDPWVTGCAVDEQVHFVFGRTASLEVGLMRAAPDGSWQTRRWPALAVDTRDVVHATDPQQDQVLVLCDARGVLVLVRDAQRTLRALLCDERQASCRVVEVARAVEGFAASATREGALIAYAGAEEAPQIMVRRLRSDELALTPASVPGACFSVGPTLEGMCGRPTLTRAGQRILLSARQGTDLVSLESADDGSSWSTPPTL